MPTWPAIAAAVSGWSPVISTMRMPARWQRSTASSDLGAWRVAHRDQAEQAQLALGVLAARCVGSPGSRRLRASASTRSPWRAKLSTWRVTRSRSEGAHRVLLAIGQEHVVQLGSTDSGAPLVCSQSRSSAGVEGGHQLALRVEVVLVSARVLAAGRVDAGGELVRGDQQRDLGRVSAAIAVGVQVSVVARGGSFGECCEGGVAGALRRV